MSETESGSLAKPERGRRRRLSDEPLPEQIGSYRVLEALGRGGMGIVYKAEHVRLGKIVALKVLAPERAAKPILLERFQREARSAARLDHPNIVAIYDQGTWNGTYYIALEYADGEDLYSYIRRRGALPPRRTLEIVRQAAEALVHAHEKGLVHRDIKPSNLLIRRDGVVQLTDMGLALWIDDPTGTQVTRAGTTVGTVDYMAPEQARGGHAVDIRSDIYSLGCTWYHMLAGQPPFPGTVVTDKLLAHATRLAPDVRTINTNVTETMALVVARMMAKDPAQRYQTPQELLRTLNLLDGRERPRRKSWRRLSDSSPDALAVEAVDEPVAEGANRLPMGQRGGGGDGGWNWRTAAPYIGAAIAMASALGLWIVLGR